jgi:mono/diheme cytochrome c family protein
MVQAAGASGKTMSKTGAQINVPARFMQDCAECHGVDATGTGPRHSLFLPEPANLTMVRDTPAMIASIIKNGIQGTAMPPEPDITNAEIQQIITFLGNASPGTQREWDWAYQYADGLPIPANMGRADYITTCAECHGATGNGVSDARENAYFWPKPANFHARNSNLGRVYYIISYGRPGTMMAPQIPKFQSAAARWAMAQYVYGMYDPNANGTIQTGKMQFHKNPYNDGNGAVVSQGSTAYTLYCGYCHGATAAGSWLAPSLIDRNWRYGGGTDTAVFEVIREGIPGKLMPPHTPLSEQTRWSIITYLRSLGGTPVRPEQYKGT